MSAIISFSRYTRFLLQSAKSSSITYLISMLLLKLHTHHPEWKPCSSCHICQRVIIMFNRSHMCQSPQQFVPYDLMQPTWDFVNVFKRYRKWFLVLIISNWKRMLKKGGMWEKRRFCNFLFRSPDRWSGGYT